MPRPDRAEPERGVLTTRDIEPLNRLFSDAFTDRYGRDGMTGIRVPFLNPAVWRYAIETAGEGALAWRDRAGQLVAFNLVHQSGTEGWMGPLAVRPDRQGAGIGRTVVQAGIDQLRARGAATIGLETMPRTVENIGFYSRLGFVPAHLTIALVHEADRSRRATVPRDGWQAEAECRSLVARLQPGVDFARELALTRELELGGITTVAEAGQVEAFALWHTVPLAAGRPRDELRVLKLAASHEAAFAALVAALRSRAAAERVERVSLRCQTEYTAAYAALVAGGFRVHWTDLRMVLDDPAPARPNHGIVMSNWEI